MPATKTGKPGILGELQYRICWTAGDVEAMPSHTMTGITVAVADVVGFILLRSRLATNDQPADLG